MEQSLSHPHGASFPQTSKQYPSFFLSKGLERKNASRALDLQVPPQPAAPAASGNLSDTQVTGTVPPNQVITVLVREIQMFPGEAAAAAPGTTL